MAKLPESKHNILSLNFIKSLLYVHLYVLYVSNTHYSIKLPLPVPMHNTYLIECDWKHICLEWNQNL